MKSMTYQHHLFTLGALATALLVGAMSPVASAATIATYSFSGNPSTTTDSIGAANLTASDLEWQPGLINGGVGGVSNTNDNLFFRSSATSGTKANAISGADFVSITLTPDAGFQLDLDTLDFNFGFDFNTQPNATMNVFTQFVVGDTDPAAIGTDIGAASSALGLVPRDTGASTAATTVDLSSIGPVTSSVTLRVYVFDDGNSNSSFVRFDEFVVAGEITATSSEPIPEPASFALMGIGGLLMLTRARRKTA